MFGQFEFLQDGTFTVIRAIASVGGAVVGWFLADPLTRVTYRVSFKGATPGSLLFLTKTMTAAALALSIWFFMPLGGFGGGFGAGPGKGGGPGKGAGPGGDSVSKDANIVPKDRKETSPKNQGAVESVEIEIIDVSRYKEDERYFLVKGMMPPLNLRELDDYLKMNQARIEVTPVLTKGSIRGTINPLGDLIELTRQYDIKTVRTRTP